MRTHELMVIKQWVKNLIAETLKLTPEEARIPFDHICHWLEHIDCFAPATFSVPFCAKNAKIFALLLLDISLDKVPALREHFSTQTILALMPTTDITDMDITKLHQELISLNLSKRHNIVSHTFETNLKNEMTKEELSLTHQLLDAYYIRFYSSFHWGFRVQAACHALAHYLICQDEANRWPKEYITKVSCQFDQFKAEYYWAYQAAKRLLNLPNFSKINPPDYSLVISDQALYDIKLWLFDTFTVLQEKLAFTNMEGRQLIYQICYWLELFPHLDYTAHPSFPFSAESIKIYALTLIEIVLEQQFNTKISLTRSLLLDEYKSFPWNVKIINKLQNDIRLLNLTNKAQFKSLFLKTLDQLIAKVPQPPGVKNMVIVLLDAYHINCFASLGDRSKTIAACLAAVRSGIYNLEKWPDDYPTKTRLTFDQFKIEYDLIDALGRKHNNKNSIAPKQKQDNISHLKKL